MANLSKQSIAHLIEVQKKLIANTNISADLREILKKDLILIAQLNSELKQYRHDSTVGAIRNIYSSRNTVEMDPLVELIKEVQTYISEKHPELLNKADDDEEFKEKVMHEIETYVTDKKLSNPNFTKREDLIAFLNIEILGLSVLDEAFNGKNADSIQEIQVNDYNDIRFIVDGQEESTPLEFRNPEHLRLLVDRLSRLAGKSGQSENLSDSKFYIRLRYQDTTRISVMGSPIARRPDGTVSGQTIHIAIRKQQSKPFDKHFLLSKGSINEYGDTLIETFVKYGVSINAYGGTGTGKTAMLRRYLGSIPDDKRIITMAEIDEMNLRQVDMRKTVIKDGQKVENKNYLRALNSALMWECTNPNTPIFGNLKGFSGLVNASLTFTPEVIVLQESKSGEIKDVVEAAISGHQVFTTIHANSPEAFFLRILLMYQQAAANISDSLILKQIPLAFPVIVNFRRYPDGSRKIAEVTELIGFDANTQNPITKTLLRYEVISNTRDPHTGKLKIKGEFYANKDEYLSDNLIRILKDNGAEDREIEQLKILYSKAPQKSFRNELV